MCLNLLCFIVQLLLEMFLWQPVQVSEATKKGYLFINAPGRTTPGNLAHCAWQRVQVLHSLAANRRCRAPNNKTPWQGSKQQQYWTSLKRTAHCRGSSSSQHKLVMGGRCSFTARPFSCRFCEVLHWWLTCSSHILKFIRIML